MVLDAPAYTGGEIDWHVFDALPDATLRRGYAIVQRADDGAVVRAPADVADGDALRLRLAEGELAARVATS